MLTIRNEQFALLRKQSLGDGLAETFEKSGQAARRDAANGDVLVNDGRENHTRFSFDQHGFVGSVTSPLGRRWRLENDNRGRLQSMTNPAGLRVAYEYSGQGEVTSVARDGNKILDLGYDESGRPVKITYADQTATLIHYSPFNSPTAITDRLGVTEAYEYDSVGNLISLVDGNGNRTRFAYSNRDRPDKVIYADGSAESYKYDPNGLVQKISVGSESLVELEHNAQGLPSKITYGDGEVLSFRYNNQGKVIEAESAAGIIKYEYDGAGRVVQEDQNGQLIKYEYDEAGTLVGLVYPSGEKIEFSYDEDLRLSMVKDWSDGLHRFSDDLNDRETTLRSPNNLVTTTLHTPQGLPASTSVAKGSAGNRGLFALSYQYDAEDRLTTFRDSEFGARVYAYDAESRLLSAKNEQSGGGEIFAYDRAGNRLHSGGDKATFNSLNQLLRQGATNCAYDARGNMISLVSSDSEWRFAYNHRNLLISAEGRDGRSIAFGYDAFGRRIWKRTGEVETRYVWAGEQMVREIIATGERTEVQDYLYLPGTCTPLATRFNNQIYYYHTDHLGTPRRLTDKEGNIVWSADYTAFGEARVKAQVLANRLRFPGQYFDQETGLHYNRFRYYSPALGRYLSRDPVMYLSGLNFYAYANNNPINSADPLGLWSWKSVVSVVAAVAVGIAVVALAPVALPLAIVAAGAAAGAVGAGLNEALNQENFSLACIAKAALKGAFVGAIAALPFAFLPATAGVAAYLGVGGLSGALSYAADQFANYPDSEWSWKDFAISVGIGAATAGLGRFLGGKYAQWKQSKASSAPKGRNSVPKSKCQTTGHPVDVATGKLFTDAIDLQLPGPLPLQFERTWYSTSTYNGPLGHGWHHSYDVGLFLAPELITVRLADGREADFAPPTSESPSYHTREKLTLHLHAQGYMLEDSKGLRYVLELLADTNKAVLTKVEDANGNTIQVLRAGEKLTGIIDSAGRQLNIITDEFNRILQITGPDPNQFGKVIRFVSYSYDQYGDMTLVRDVLDHPFAYVYQNHLLIQETDRTGLSFYFEYQGDDAEARCVRTWGDGNIYYRTLEYDLAKRLTTVRDLQEHQTTYTWNDLGLVTREVDPLGREKLYEWDANANKLAETNGSGQTTRYEYDDYGRLTAVINPLGHRREWGYDEAGNVVSLTDEAGAQWRREFDQRRNVIALINPAGSKWTYETDDRGLPVVSTDPEGKQTTLAWDQQGNLRRITDRTGARTQFEHNALGRMTRRIDPLGGETRIVWTRAGDIAEVRNASGGTSRFTYDAHGNMLEVTDQLGNQRRYAYGPRGLLTRVQEPSGSTTSYKYDADGQLVAVIDARGREWTMELDAVGNIVSERFFDGRRVDYEYDLDDRRKAIINARGQRTELKRDEAGRLVERLFHDGTSEKIAYDPRGLLVKAENSAAMVTREYDVVGQVIGEAINGERLQLEYDALGNRVARTSPYGRMVRMTYDAEQRLESVNDGMADLLSIAYDPAGREVRRTLPGDVVCERSYTAADYLASSRTHRRGRTLLEREYRYEGGFQLQELRDSSFGLTSFQHDVDGRLAAATYPDRAVERFLYDAAGNVPGTPDSTLRSGPDGYVTQADGWHLRYDADGNLITKDGYAVKYLYEYDAAGRLARVVKDDSEVVEFAYDALGRRVKKKTQAATIEFLWDGEVLLGERAVTDVGQVKDSYEYLFVPGSFEPVAVFGEAENYLLECDHSGTPRAATNLQGEVVWQAQYAAFGRIKKILGSTNAVPFRFPGQYSDVETGLSYNRFRYYDPDLRMYQTPDPLGLVGGTESYNYVPSPVAWIDPYGLNRCPIADKRIQTFPDEPGVYHIEGPNGQVYTGEGVSVRARLNDPEHTAYHLLSDPKTKVTIRTVNMKDVDMNSRSAVNRSLRIQEQTVMNQTGNVPKQGGSLNKSVGLTEPKMQKYGSDPAYQTELGPPVQY